MKDIVYPDFEDPNHENKFNYLLDTTVFNRLVENKAWFLTVLNSLKKGFRYYITANQYNELHGVGAKTYDQNCVPHVHISDAFQEKIDLFDDILGRLHIKRLSSIASFMSNHWVLDGTYRILDDTTACGKMTEELLAFNEKLRQRKPFAQHYDAMTAEAAMYHGYYLVSDDNDLGNIVNKYFPQKAIQTKDLIAIIQTRLR